MTTHRLLWVLVALVLHCNCETFDEVLKDCQANIRGSLVCNGAKESSGEIENDCFEEDGGLGNCQLVVRGKVVQKHEGVWEPSLLLTVAVKRASNNEIGFLSVKLIPEIGLPCEFYAHRGPNGSLFTQILIESKVQIVKQRLEPKSSVHKQTMVVSIVLPRSHMKIGEHTVDVQTYRYVQITYGITNHEWVPDTRREKVLNVTIPAFELLEYKGYRYTGCGDSRTFLCYGFVTMEHHQRGCLLTAHCDTLATIKSSSQETVDLYLTRQLEPDESGYVSLGFSLTRKMGGTLVFDCIKREHLVKTYNSFNIERNNVPLRSKLEFPTKTRYRNKLLECIWSIGYNLTYEAFGFKLNLHENQYHVLMAVGSVADSRPNLRGAHQKFKHIRQAVYSKMKVPPYVAHGRVVDEQESSTTARTRTMFLVRGHNPKAHLIIWFIVFVVSVLTTIVLIILGRRRSSKLTSAGMAVASEENKTDQNATLSELGAVLKDDKDEANSASGKRGKVIISSTLRRVLKRAKSLDDSSM